MFIRSALFFSLGLSPASKAACEVTSGSLDHGMDAEGGLERESALRAPWVQLSKAG